MKLAGMSAAIVFTIWLYGTTGRKLANSSRRWKAAFLITTLAGLVAGFRLATLTYFTSPTLRPYGWPFDFGGAEFFNGTWHAGLLSRLMLLAILADVSLGLLAFIAPFRVVQEIWHLSRSSHAGGTQTR